MIDAIIIVAIINIIVIPATDNIAIISPQYLIDILIQKLQWLLLLFCCYCG
jgi:hypothetical protein